MRQALFLSKQSIEQTPMQMSDGHANAIKCGALPANALDEFHGKTRSIWPNLHPQCLHPFAAFTSRLISTTSSCVQRRSFPRTARTEESISQEKCIATNISARAHPSSAGYARSNSIITALAEPQDLQS